MKSIKVVLVDDEESGINILKFYLKQHFPDLEVVGEANNISSAKELLETYPVDLVFLDIHLNNFNSFQLLENLEKWNFEIIFTSAHSNYGVSAFKVDAVDYLLKPFELSELERAIEKYYRKRQGGRDREQTSESQESDFQIPVHVNDEVEFIKSTQITSFVAARNYTEIHTVDRKKYYSSKNLGSYEELLASNDDFLRIHRSVIINVNHIASYSKSIPFSIQLADEMTFEISRRKRNEILSFLKSLNL